MNALFFELCFPFPEFQVRCVAFDGTTYYIFIFDTIRSPNRVTSIFWKDALFIFFSQNPEIALS